MANSERVPARGEYGHFPHGASEHLAVSEVVSRGGPAPEGETLANRLISLAAQLPSREGFVGYQLEIPREGLSSMSLFGSEEVSGSDLAWACEFSAKARAGESGGITGSHPLDEGDLLVLEVGLSLEDDVRPAAVGFGPAPAGRSAGRGGCRGAGRFILPAYFGGAYPGLIQALRGSGAVLRYAAGSATAEEQRILVDDVLARWPVDRSCADALIATPAVRARLLIALPHEPTLRQRSQVAAILRGSRLRPLGRMSDPDALAAWDAPLAGAPVLPGPVAQMLAVEPVPGERPILGLATCKEPARTILASHGEPEGAESVMFGRAVGTDGLDRDVRIPIGDLCRHVMVIGQTGTGKSTVIEQAALSALGRGIGMTVIDPHGSTVDKILRCIPASQADRVRVVRMGDLDNPVPMCMWTNDNPYDQERSINDIAELFQAIMDPENKGMVGPRFVHIWQTFAKAAIARFGRLASFETVIAMARDKNGCMLGVCKAIEGEYPDLAQAVASEFGRNRSSDYEEVMQWFISKFSRFTGSEHLRRTFGAGANALDYANAIDNDTVTLISLDSPVLGTVGARMAGSLILMDLWRATMARGHRERTHMVFVDEAHLFQSDPLPRMLGEARKFGLSLTLCTQHCDAFSPEVRYALDANSANYIAFRQSARDARDAAVRLDDLSLEQPLRRLDALNGIATVSVDGCQSPAFSIKLDIPDEQENGEEIARRIEQRSAERLVGAHRGLRALTVAEIADLASNPEKEVRGLESACSSCEQDDCPFGEQSAPRSYGDPEGLADRLDMVEITQPCLSEA